MFVTSLVIKKRERYEDNAGQLYGSVVLEGANGKQEIVLSAGAISRVFGVIAQEVQDRAGVNAQAVRAGMDEAVNAPLLMDASKVSDEGDLK